MKNIAFKLIALIVMTSQMALANTTVMNEAELQQIKLGLRTALTQQLPKRCTQINVNTIGNQKSISQYDCTNDLNTIVITRLENHSRSESSFTTGQLTQNEDGSVEIKLSRNFAPKPMTNVPELTSHILIVRLSKDQKRIEQLFIRSVVRVLGSPTNVGTIINPIFQNTDDIYEETQQADF